MVVVISTLVAGLVVLAISVVGLAQSLKFVMNAADAIGDIGAIAPEPAAPAGSAVILGSAVANATETPLPHSGAAGSGPNSSALRTIVPAATVGGTAAASGSGGAPAPSDIAAQTGGGAATGSTAGEAASAPSIWDDAVRNVLALISQNTISMCGRNTCNTGQVCCNASCGICVAPGATCDQQQCAGAPRTPTSVLCGTGQCNDGQVCCNASCGICAAPGEACSDKKCR